MCQCPAKSWSVSSAEEFLSEIVPSIMRPRNLTGLEWIEGISKTSGWTDDFETEKGIVFIDLPLTITVEIDLSPLISRPAQVKAVMYRESKSWPPEGLEAIRLRSSIKAQSKGNMVLLVVYLGTLALSIQVWCSCQLEDMESDEKNSYGHWIVYKRKKAQYFTVFISQSFFKVPKTRSLNATHYFIMKICKRRDLLEIPWNHLCDNNFQDFIKLYQEYIKKPYLLLVNEMTLLSDNPLQFSKNLSEMSIRKLKQLTTKLSKTKRNTI